jgi:hypothetical protein
MTPLNSARRVRIRLAGVLLLLVAAPAFMDLTDTMARHNQVRGWLLYPHRQTDCLPRSNKLLQGVRISGHDIWYVRKASQHLRRTMRGEFGLALLDLVL